MRGENGDGFSDNNISWCKEERGEKEEKEAWLPSPSPSLFPSEEMAAGAAPPPPPMLSRLCIYLANPFRTRRRVAGERGGENRSGGERESERCEEDHHLVPVRLCVCLRVQASAVRPSVPSPAAHFPLLEVGEGGRNECPLNNQQKTIVSPKGMPELWRKWTLRWWSH